LVAVFSRWGSPNPIKIADIRKASDAAYEDRQTAINDPTLVNLEETE
jgi:hypothetical protein